MKRRTLVLSIALLLLIGVIAILIGVLVGNNKEDDVPPMNTPGKDSPTDATPTRAPTMVQDEPTSDHNAEPNHVPTTSPGPITTPLPLETRLVDLILAEEEDSSSVMMIGSSTSPPAQAFQLMLEQTSFSNELSDDRLLQRFAILTFWFSTGGPTTWTIPSWGQPTDECTWNSITCDSDGHVTSIRTCCDGLSGVLPPELGLLTTVDLFDVHSSTMLGGTIPSEIGLMTSLTWLDLNDLPGLASAGSNTIPTEIGNLEKLKFLGMFGTNLEGDVPSSSLASLSNLEQLYLYANNNLVGTVPPLLCNTLTRGLVDCDEVECDCCNQGVLFFNDGEACDAPVSIPTAPTLPAPSPTPYPPSTTNARATILTNLIQANSPSSSLEDTSSPSYQAYNWVVEDDMFWTEDDLLSDERLLQRFAILTFWFSTGGPSTWTIPSWGQPTDECTWDAITCDSNGQVIRIRVCCGGVSGSLPPELGLLSSVELLDVHSNTMLAGTIPSEIGLMTSLTWLDMNDLPGLSAGTIPSDFGNLVELNFLGMFGNNLEGPVPSSSLEALSNLGELYLYENNLSGGSIPSSLCSHLTRALIDCDDVECGCCKQGVPFFNDGDACVSNPSPTLPPTSSPSKALPTSTSRASMLADLIEAFSPASTLTDPSSPSYLAYQWMVNEDTFWLDNLTLSDSRSLQRFAMVTFWYATGGPTTWNSFDEGWISGTSECSWGGVRCTSDTSVVQMLWRSYVGLSNMIPREIGLLSGLLELDVEENMLEGHLPMELTLLDSLTQLSVGNDYTGGENKIEGLFDVVVNMPMLETLNCYSCGLAGTIPTEIGQMAGLRAFDLRRNLLTGSIPSEIGMLPNLLGFTVGDNALSGPIPTELFSLSLNFLDVYGNYLTGTIPCDDVGSAAINCGDIECDGSCCVQGFDDGVTGSQCDDR